MVRGKSASVRRPWFWLNFSGDNWWCPWYKNFETGQLGFNISCWIFLSTESYFVMHTPLNTSVSGWFRTLFQNPRLSRNLLPGSYLWVFDIHYSPVAPPTRTPHVLFCHPTHIVLRKSVLMINKLSPRNWTRVNTSWRMRKINLFRIFIGISKVGSLNLLIHKDENIHLSPLW